MSNDLNASRAFEPDLRVPAASLDPGGTRLDKRLVHKSYDENVLVSHIEAVQPAPDAIPQGEKDGARDRTDHFRAVLCINRDHPLFFDRDSGHVHAICFMETAQQTAMAVAHLFYGVPLDVEFVTTDCSAKFLSVANIDEPLIADQIVSAHVYRRGRLVRMHTTFVIRQGSLERVRLAGIIVLLKREQLKHLEERASTTYSFNPATIQPTGVCS